MAGKVMSDKDARVAPEMMSEAENRSGLADREDTAMRPDGQTRGKPDHFKQRKDAAPQVEGTASAPAYQSATPAAAAPSSYEKAIQRALLQACHKCDYDEAEGALIDHCQECCHRIVGLIWEHTFLDKWAGDKRDPRLSQPKCHSCGGWVKVEEGGICLPCHTEDSRDD
jgi:hypothetical protein